MFRIISSVSFVIMTLFLSFWNSNSILPHDFCWGAEVLNLRPPGKFVILNTEFFLPRIFFYCSILLFFFISLLILLMSFFKYWYLILIANFSVISPSLSLLLVDFPSGYLASFPDTLYIHGIILNNRTKKIVVVSMFTTCFLLLLNRVLLSPGTQNVRLVFIICSGL